MTDPGPLVIKIGGSTLDDHLSNDALWLAVAGLAAASPRSSGVVIVHGGGKAVDRQLARLGVISERKAGLRVTPKDQIDDVVSVLAGSVNKAIVGSLLRVNARPVGLCLGDGAMVSTVKSDPPGVDLGRVGAVEGGDAALAKVLIASGYVPVVCSIGLDARGEPLNINADDAAAGLAGALRASALILLTDVPGIKDGKGTVRHRLTPGEIESMIASGEISGGMIPKSRAATRVATDRRVPVVILGADDPRHLISWIAGDPVGTEIVPEESHVQVPVPRASAPAR